MPPEQGWGGVSRSGCLDRARSIAREIWNRFARQAFMPTGTLPHLRADLVLLHLCTTTLDGHGAGLLVAIFGDGEVGVALAALAVDVFLPGGYPGVVALGIAHADFAGGVQRRYLAGAEFGEGPVVAVDAAAFFIAASDGGCNGLFLATIAAEGEGFLELFVVVTDAHPGTIGVAGFDDADVMKRIQIFHKNLSLVSMQSSRSDCSVRAPLCLLLQALAHVAGHVLNHAWLLAGDSGDLVFVVLRCRVKSYRFAYGRRQVSFRCLSGQIGAGDIHLQSGLVGGCRNNVKIFNVHCFYSTDHGDVPG